MTRRKFITSLVALPVGLIAAAKSVATPRRRSYPGKLIITSTPSGEPRWFYDLWSSHDQDAFRCYFAGVDHGSPDSDRSSISMWETQPGRAPKFVRAINADELKP